MIFDGYKEPLVVQQFLKAAGDCLPFTGHLAGGSLKRLLHSAHVSPTEFQSSLARVNVTEARHPKHVAHFVRRLDVVRIWKLRRH